jgi:hypothetical protein
MAFNMKRPIIKGTPLHKASIAKAKESIVSQARTQADASLVSGGRLLGESYVPDAIDFSIDIPEIDIEKKDAEEKPEERDKSKDKKATKIPKKKKLKAGDTSGPDLKKRVPPRDKSGDKEATKIKPIKPGESKGKKSKGPDLETRVAPYVEEAEDEDEFDLNDLDDESSDASVSQVDGSEGVNRGYKNWKVREEEKLLAEAEALKAKADAESRARAPKVSNIESASASQLPTTEPNSELEQTGATPEEKSGKVKAHNNPDYETKGSTTNSEGQTTSIGGTPPEKPGYSYDATNDQWTYNDIRINEDEVRLEEFKGIMEMVKNEQEQEYNKKIEQKETDLNSNTPSADSTNTQDLLPVTKDNEVKLTPRQIREKKRADKKYNDPSTGPNVKNQMIKEGYTPIQSKSPMEMRDDRIYRNAKPNGQVRKNMIQGGYMPQ